MRFTALSAFAWLWFVFLGNGAGTAFCEDAQEWQKTQSGLEYRSLARGPEGPSPAADSAVRVQYTGKLEDGRLFDSTRVRGVPREFRLDDKNIIKGWAEALQLMRVGDHFEFRIPSDLAYGAAGAGGVIPPNATLVYDFVLDEIVPPFEFAKVSAEKARATAAGMKYEIVKEGSGDALSNKAMELRFALFDDSGKMLTSSLDEGPILGRGDDIAEAMVSPMFRDVPALLRVGSTLRCEAPAKLALSEKLIAKTGMQPDSPTHWLITATRAVDVPAFIKPDESKLQTTPSGLKYQVLSRGSDPAAKQPKAGDGVAVDYAGWFADGTPFDSSYSRATFLVGMLKRGPGGLIDGWIEGLQLMKEGDRFLLVVPPALAYGASGNDRIPPDSTLVFLIELHMVP